MKIFILYENKITQRTETSKYLQEKKSIEILKVVVSEIEFKIL